MPSVVVTQKCGAECCVWMKYIFATRRAQQTSINACIHTVVSVIHFWMYTCVIWIFTHGQIEPVASLLYLIFFFIWLVRSLGYLSPCRMIQMLRSWLKKCMWSLRAEQTCQIDEDQLQTGYALAQNAQGTECRTDSVLYAVGTNARTCDLQCDDGWYHTQNQTPTMSCGPKSDHNSADGESSYTGCERKWSIMNGSHNGIVCRIGDLLLRWLDSYLAGHVGCLVTRILMWVVMHGGTK